MYIKKSFKIDQKFMVFFTLNFIIGMAFIGLILLVKNEEINFKIFSIVAIILSLVSLITSMFIETHYAPLLIA
jgi:hypothetical protein